MKKRAGKSDESTSERNDIIDLIERDHKPLKAWIKIMKGERTPYGKKKAAFKQFAPALIAHAKPEEKTWYSDMKSQAKMKIDGIEGEVEHGLADQLCKELKKTVDQAMFMAKVKVLAEMVEHHIEEEEQDMLPSFRKKSTKTERAELGATYEKLRQRFL